MKNYYRIRTYAPGARISEQTKDKISTAVIWVAGGLYILAATMQCVIDVVK